MSITLVRLPSRCAAIASTDPTVTTPVPPMPATRTFQLRIGASAGEGGSGRFASASRSSFAAWGLRGWPPCTLTNDGQKPFTQLKSLLQLDWSISRLRPNSVSFGRIETQLACTEQSPQPSQTASLMKTRRGGSDTSPRLRHRLSSAAQVCS